METLKNILKTDYLGNNKKRVNNKYEFNKKYETFNYKTYNRIKNKKFYHIKYYDLKFRNKKNFTKNKLSICNFKTDIIKYWIY